MADNNSDEDEEMNRAIRDLVAILDEHEAEQQQEDNTLPPDFFEYLICDYPEEETALFGAQDDVAHQSTAHDQEQPLDVPMDLYDLLALYEQDAPVDEGIKTPPQTLDELFAEHLVRLRNRWTGCRIAGSCFLLFLQTDDPAEIPSLSEILDMMPPPPDMNAVEYQVRLFFQGSAWSTLFYFMSLSCIGCTSQCGRAPSGTWRHETHPAYR